MDVCAARVPGPDAFFTLQSSGLGCVMLLNPKVSHSVTSSVQRADQLRAVVQQRLTPLGVTRAHRENAALELQWSAMGGELRSGDLRPVLPERC